MTSNAAIPFYQSVIFRYLAIVVPSVLIVCCIMIWFAINESRERDSQDAILERQVIVDIMAGALREPLWNFDDEVVKETAMEIFNRADVLGVRIEDNMGKIVAEMGPPFSQEAGTDIRGQAMSQVQSSVIYRNAHIEEKAGTLIICFDNKHIHWRMAQRQRAAILTMVGAIAVVLLVAILAMRPLILQPLMQLERGIERAMRGMRFSPIPNKRRDEFGHLTLAFNRMLEFLHERETALEQQALTDSLTGLPNRLMFTRRTEAYLKKAKPFSMGLIDFNNFKQVNDTLGHATGDSLIKSVASRLSGKLVPGDEIARLGGDEFALLITGTTTQCLKKANEYLRVLDEPVMAGSAHLNVSASLGLARWPQDGRTASDLLRAADMAMYDAKHRGMATAQLFHVSILKNMMDAKSIEDHIREGLDNRWFSLVYQDIVSAGNRKMVGAEALLRLHHPEKGNIRPDIFVPVAEQTGLILPLGKWVLEKAFEDLALAKSQLAGRSFFFSINISAWQINEELPHLAGRLARRFAILPSEVNLEITETALLQDKVDVAGILAQIRELGFRISLDDFGTGYSSLMQLRDFPVDIIKADRSFIIAAASEVADERCMRSLGILRGLVSMSNAMDMPLVAEGIETDHQFDRISDLGVSMFQGYLFSRPQPLRHWLSKHADQLESARVEMAI